MINGSKREKSEEDRQTDGGIGWVENIPRRRVDEGSSRGRRVGPRSQSSERLRGPASTNA